MARDITLSYEQQQCVDFCLNSNRPLTAVTGQAGTGKTTLIRYIAEKLKQDFAIAAPTGKAAKRIHEATGLRAVTIHKLLEYGRPRERDLKTGEPVSPTTPRRDKENTLNERIILVDEYSMVNHELNRNLIDALPRGGRLIMFGDVSQLSPIEPYPIRTTPDSPFIQHLARDGCSFTLNEVFRQREGSDILNAATSIRKGQVPRRGERFRYIMTDEPVKRLKILLDSIDVDFSKIENQILTPVRGKWIGTGALNVLLRNRYNPEGPEAINLMRYPWDEKNAVTISIGDKVVCTENTYDMRHYSERFTEFDDEGKAIYDSFIPTPDTKYMLNGETGIVTEIFPDTTIEVDFGDRTIEIPYMYEEYSDKKGTFHEVYPQRALDLAYALTVHKAQGSEYQHVLYVINTAVSYMLSRENIYTAVTRAKESVHVVCDHTSLMVSLRITREMQHKRSAAREARKKSIVSDKVKEQLRNKKR